MPRILPPTYFPGLDPGREQDHTALVFLDRSSIVLDAYDPTTFERVVQSRLTIRHFRRFPLRMSFYDFLRTPQPAAPVIPITITAGHSACRKHSSGSNVPKALLFSTLYTAFKDNHITIARKLRFARALLSALAVYLALKIHKPITGHGALPGIPAFNSFPR